MVCRHRPGDPDCGSWRYETTTTTYPSTPDANNYEVVDAQTVGKHLVMKVRYPNCANCAYEGTKVLVFLNCTAIQALRWKRIDPHFRDPKLKVAQEHAPSPSARFPASGEGWADALAFATSKH